MTTPAAASKSAAPMSFPSDAVQAAITTDFLALVGFAARLGTCVNNDASGNDPEERDGQDAKSVRDEAMLLMSLLMGEKAEEILSEEIGAKELRCQKRNNRRNNSDNKKPHVTGDNSGEFFEFSFPSLSLQPESATQKSAATEASKVAGNPSDAGVQEASKGGASAAHEDEADQPPPSQLLGRPQITHDKDGIRDGSEAMAHNVLGSFGAALVWRAKTWIKSLTNVLALKEEKRIEALEKANDNPKDEDKTGGEPTQEKSEHDEIMNSKEMQIIDAIVKSSEEVSVVNIKTSFRVLPNKVSTVQTSIRDPHLPSPSKKPKPESSLSPKDQGDEYSVTHKLVFEATISMTSNDGVRYNGVKLHAPGTIQGTFTKNKSKSNNGSPSKKEEEVEGDEILSAVSMTLDTEALALSLERQSRLVVRRAAEAAILAASGVDVSSSPRYLESPHVHHSVISPRYVLMSPVPAHTLVGAGGYFSSGQQQQTMLPPVPSAKALNGYEDGHQSDKSTSAVVSSSEGGGCSSDSSAATIPTFSPSMNSTKAGNGGKDAPQSPSLPALLSVANKELTRGD